MFAVIKTGGKQYRVAKDDYVVVEKIVGEAGDVVSLDTVLMIGGDGMAPTVGMPLVDKAAVFAEVVEQGRADKIIVFKKKRRQNYRRKAGHRQDQTVLRIVEVSPTGAKPKGTSVAKVALAKTEEKVADPKKATAAKKPAAKKADDSGEVKKAAATKAPAKKSAPKDTKE
jgi:large subunit ribosomal protein L21